MTQPQEPKHPLWTVVQNLPERPGVYQYFDANNGLLYVGKAKNLRNRVKQYFQKSDHSPRIALMISQIVRIEHTVTASETDALLLEHTLIQTRNPRYNIVFRDDKSYPLVRLSADPFARISYYRGKKDKTNLYFGPYPNGQAVRHALEVIQKVFRLRTCDNTTFAHRTRPCMLYQINRCTAPCVGLISQVEYQNDVRQATQLLRGRGSQVILALEAKMLSHAQALAFEEAAICRNQIQALQQLAHQSVMHGQSWHDADIIACQLAGSVLALNVAMVRNGQYLGDRQYFTRRDKALMFQDTQQSVDSGVEVLSQYEDALAPQLDVSTGIEKSRASAVMAPVRDDASLVALYQEALSHFIVQYYLDVPVPSTIVTHVAMPDESLLKFLQQRRIEDFNQTFDGESDAPSANLTREQQKALRFRWVSAPKKEQKQWLDLAVSNLSIALSQHGQTQHKTQLQIQSLLKTVPFLPHDIESLRIVCFDVSHTSGQTTVASCVVYAQGQLQPSAYRRYTIRTVSGGDDYGALREALTRHFSRWQTKPLAKKTKINQFNNKLHQRQGFQSDEGSDTAISSTTQEPFPHLVIIDGGKAQLGVAIEVFTELGLDTACLIGIAKGEKRAFGKETLWLAHQSPVQLAPNDPALSLLGSIRDEAHRFAITGMRKQRAKKQQVSQLDAIEGIGPVRRRRLLTRFGSFKGVMNASIEELMGVEGISLKLAKHIHAQCNQK